MVKNKKPKKTKEITLQEGTELAGVYKEKEFQEFVLWLSLPALLKGRSAEYLEQIGITDEDATRLLEIKNLSAFADKYKIENSTLTEWKKKAKEIGLLETSKDFYRGLTSNVFHAFYFETLKNADAARVRLWLEEFAGKAPEAPPVINQNILTPQFSQVIGQLKVKYSAELRKYYEDQIRKSAEESGEIPSPERVRPDKTNK